MNHRSVRVLLVGWSLLAPAWAAQAGNDFGPEFCNVACESGAPDAWCRLGAVGGLELAARRRDLAVLPTGDGLVARGDLTIPTGGDRSDGIALAEASLELRFSASACATGFDVVRGEARLPVPASGVLASADVEIARQPMASLGIDLGRNLIAVDSPWCPDAASCECTDFCLGVPIPRADRHYFFFDVQAAYAFRLGAAVLESPGAAATFVLDPADPYFFLTGSTMGLPALPNPLPGGSAGFGFSLAEEIPFVPIETYGFEDRAVAFTGGYAATTLLPLLARPELGLEVEIEGTVVAALDPDHDGDHPFLTPAAFLGDPDLAIGANGVAHVAWSPWSEGGRRDAKRAPKPRQVRKAGKKAKRKGVANPFLGIDLEIGAASGGGRVRPDSTEVWVSGRMGSSADEIFPSWLPLPVRAGGDVKLAGYFSTHVAESWLAGEGTVEIDPANLAKWAKVDVLGPLRTYGAALRVDREGFRVIGRTGSQLHADVEQTSESEVEAFVAPNGEDSALALRTTTRVAGEELSQSELVLSTRGIALSGLWDLGAYTVAMSGRFTRSNGRLTGTTQIAFPYSREDTIRKAELLDRILNQTAEVEALELALQAANAALATSLAHAEAAGRAFDAAIAEVGSLDAALAALVAERSRLLRDRQAQLDRNCDADFSGCRTCSYRCDCDCEAWEVGCLAACATCNAAYGACVSEREICRAGNVVGCEVDRAAKIAALTTALAGAEIAIASTTVARDAALGVLETARAANDLARSGLAASGAAAGAAANGLDAAQRGLAELRDLLDHLPAVEGTILADAALEIRTVHGGPPTKRGKLTARFEGKTLATGRIDLEASPRKACLSVAAYGIGELCTAL
jgi:hypothetical protein